MKIATECSSIHVKNIEKCLPFESRGYQQIVLLHTHMNPHSKSNFIPGLRVFHMALQIQTKKKSKKKKKQNSVSHSFCNFVLDLFFNNRFFMSCWKLNNFHTFIYNIIIILFYPQGAKKIKITQNWRQECLFAFLRVE